MRGCCEREQHENDTCIYHYLFRSGSDSRVWTLLLCKTGRYFSKESLPSWGLNCSRIKRERWDDLHDSDASIRRVCPNGGLGWRWNKINTRYASLLGSRCNWQSYQNQYEQKDPLPQAILWKWPTLTWRRSWRSQGSSMAMNKKRWRTLWIMMQRSSMKMALKFGSHLKTFNSSPQSFGSECWRILLDRWTTLFYPWSYSLGWCLHKVVLRIKMQPSWQESKQEHAAEAGLQNGDEILAVEGVDVSNWSELTTEIQSTRILRLL